MEKQVKIFAVMLLAASTIITHNAWHNTATLLIMLMCVIGSTAYTAKDLVKG